jgi:N-acetylmuramoyl-L-alanine amidase
LRLLVLLACVSALTACAPAIQRPGVATVLAPTPNKDARRANFVILHHTSNNTAAKALEILTSAQKGVSAHYLVGRNGTIWQLADEQDRTWHAGASWWGGQTDVNSASIGVELDNNGAEPYAEVQIRALLGLLRDIRQRLRIPAANFLGHGDVAPGRKVDPGANFPWRELALAGFGLWCDPPYPAAPAGLDNALALRALGYDTGRPDAALRAFRRHFVGTESGDPVTSEERNLMSCLLGKRTFTD